MLELARSLAPEREQVVPITVFVAILCLCLVVGHLLEENRWVNESITAILIGHYVFLTKPLIKQLLPPPSWNSNSSSGGPPETPPEDMSLPLLSIEESATTNILRAKDSLSILMERPVYTIHHCWRRFDDTYMRPIFGGPLSSSSE